MKKWWRHTETFPTNPTDPLTESTHPPGDNRNLLLPRNRTMKFVPRLSLLIMETIAERTS